MKWMTRILIILSMVLMASFSMAQEDATEEPDATPESTEAPDVPAVNLEDAIAIAFGETIEGELQAGGRDNYTFEAEEGTAIIVSMEADFDAFVYVLNTDAEILAVDDDSGTQLNALLNGFVVPETGTYVIQAASGDDTREGAYTLTLETTEIPMLQYGVPAEATMERATAIYEFEAAEGDLLVSFLNAEGFDTSMILQAPSGREVARSTFADFFGQVARLGPVSLPEDGIYRFTLFAQGEFMLTAFPIFPINIPMGQTATAEFGPQSPMLFFSFEPGEVEDLDVIVDTGDSLPIIASVLNPAAYAIAGSFPSEDRIRDPYLPGVELNSTDTYYIMLSGFDPSVALEGEVSVTIQETTLQSLDDGPITLALNNADNDRGDAELVFTGSAGTRVNLVVNIDSAAPNAEPYIEVRQNDRLLGAFNQNGLATYIITFEVLEDGPVVVDLQSSAETVLTISLGDSEA